MDGKLHSARKLACANEVSTKTISRAVNTLLSAGVAVETKLGKNGGYYLNSNFIPQLMSTNSRTLSEFLAVAKQQSTIIPTNNNCTIESIINSTPKNNVKSVIEMSNKLILDNLPWGIIKVDNSKFDTIYCACMNTKVIEFDYVNYKSEVSFRRIDPYCITMKSGTWYVYGYCKATNKFKLFKLTRMSNIKVTNEQFNAKDIDTNLKPWNNLDNLSPQEISVKIKSQNLEEIKEWLNLKIIKSINNDNIIATAVVQESDGFYIKLIEEAKNIKLLSPEHMVKKLIEKCKSIETMYENSQLAYSV